MSCKTQNNPQTNRCVLKTGKIGSRILGRPKLCDTVFNSATNRCILRQNSVKGKKVKINASRHKTDCLYVPRQYQELVDKCACNEKWMKRVKIGSGAFGKVYQACRFRGENLVVKVQQNDRFAKAEFQAYTALQNKRILPNLFAAWLCQGKMYMLLEQLYDCEQPATQLVKRVERKMEKLLQLGWLHGDLHKGNVMCRKNNQLVLIDFGLSVQKRKAPYANHPRKTTFRQLQKNQADQLNDMLHEIS